MLSQRRAFDLANCVEEDGRIFALFLVAETALAGFVESVAGLERNFGDPGKGSTEAAVVVQTESSGIGKAAIPVWGLPKPKFALQSGVWHLMNPFAAGVERKQEEGKEAQVATESEE